MSNHKTKAKKAAAYNDAARFSFIGLPEPVGQKFPVGSRVRIAKDLGPMMRHFASNTEATVLYTYGHLYEGSAVHLYALDIDGHGYSAWYNEHHLTAVKEAGLLYPVRQAIVPDEDKCREEVIAWMHANAISFRYLKQLSGVPASSIYSMLAATRPFNEDAIKRIYKAMGEYGE